MEMIVPANTIAMDEQVLVRQGEKIPTDGVVTEGSSSVEESSLTGQSLPPAKLMGGDTALAQTVRLVEEAQTSGASVERLADQATGYFVPAVMLIAFAAFGLWILAGPFQHRAAELRCRAGDLLPLCPRHPHPGGADGWGATAQPA